MEAFLQVAPGHRRALRAQRRHGPRRDRGDRGGRQGPGEDIKIITVDAVKDGMQALADGKINFIVECNPLLGPQLMDLVKKVVAGEEVPARVVTEETTFTQEQAKAALPDPPVLTADRAAGRWPAVSRPMRHRRTDDRPRWPTVAPVSRCRHRKAFPGVKALDGVDFRLLPGRGARPDGRERRRQVDPDQGADRRLPDRRRTDPRARRRPGRVQRARRRHRPAGVSTVYQEVNLCPNLSVAENIFIGREPRRARPDRLARRAPPGRRAAGAGCDLDIDVVGARRRTRSPCSRWSRSPGPSTSTPGC